MDAAAESEVERLRRVLARERLARRQAEDIAEKHLREIWDRERQANLLASVAKLANESTRVTGALARTLELVGAFFTMDLGHALVVSDDSPTTLESSGVWWERRAGRAGGLRALLAGRASDALLSPAAITWTGGDCVAALKSAPMDGFSAEVVSLPAVLADQGVQSALAVPVRAGADIVAVLEFFGFSAVVPTSVEFDLLHQIGVQLGRIVERGRENGLIERRAARRSAEIVAARDATAGDAAGEFALIAAAAAKVRDGLVEPGTGPVPSPVALAGLADDVAALAVAHDTGSQPPVTPAMTGDLAAALRRAAAELPASVGANVPAVAVTAAVEVPVVGADEVALAVARLAARTADLRDPGEPVRVSIEVEDGMVVARCDGVGPALEVDHRIAVAILRAEVRALHGRCLPEAEATAVLEVWLPAADVEHTGPGWPSEPVGVRRVKVLLGSPEGTYRLINRAVFEGLGASVEAASDASMIAAAAARTPFDLILLDEALPGLATGYLDTVRDAVQGAGWPAPVIRRLTTATVGGTAESDDEFPGDLIGQPLSREIAVELIEAAVVRPQ